MRRVKPRGSVASATSAPEPTHHEEDEDVRSVASPSAYLDDEAHVEEDSNPMECGESGFFIQSLLLGKEEESPSEDYLEDLSHKVAAAVDEAVYAEVEARKEARLRRFGVDTDVRPSARSRRGSDEENEEEFIDDVAESFRRKLEARSKRFGIVSDRRESQDLITERTSVDLPLPPPPPKRPRRDADEHRGSAYGSMCPSTGSGQQWIVKRALAILPGKWECEDDQGRPQVHEVSESEAKNSHMTCQTWEKVGGSWRRKKNFAIYVSLEKSQVLWGEHGRVWLDLDTLSRNEVRWRSKRGTGWRWQRSKDYRTDFERH